MAVAKPVHLIQLSLIESASCSHDQLFAAESLLSRPDYEDVVVERSISGLCGYPPCPKALPLSRDRRGRFRVSLSEHRVYGLEETYNFCSEACVVKSRAFSRSLNAERLSYPSEAKIEQVLRAFGLWNVVGEELKGGDLGIESLSIQEKGDAGAGEVSFDEWIGPSNAIDGYVPQNDRIGDSGRMLHHNSRKIMEIAGDSGIPSVSSIFMGNKAEEIHSKDYFSANRGVSKMIVKGIPAASTAEKKTKSKKSTSKTSKVKGNFFLEDYENSNMDVATSIMVGNEFGDCNTSSPTAQDISDMITKKLENIVLEEKNTRKSVVTSKPSKFKHLRKSEDAMNEDVERSNTINVKDDVKTVSGKVSFNVESTLEALASRVENLVVMEDQSSNKPSKLSKPKTKKKKAKKNNGKPVIEYFASIIDSDDAASSSQSHPSEALSKKVNGEVGNVCFSKGSEKKVINISYYGVSSGNEVSSDYPKTKSEEKLLRSSLKTSGSETGSRTVKWSDEQIVVLEEKNVIFQEASKEDSDNFARFTSAKVCAAALIQSAESVASGKTEVEEAVSEAGILILPQSQSLHGEKEDDHDTYKLEQGLVKWPKKTMLLDTDMFDVEDSWHDTTPEGFNLNLSQFATMWMALFGWINCSSLAYIYGYDETSLQNFILINGKEYPQKAMLRDGQSLEIRKTLDGFICRILHVLAKDQRLPIPISTIEKFMGGLLDTMSFMDAIPSFKIRQWNVIVFLFIEALSVHRLPVLSPHLMCRGEALQQMLHSARISNEEYGIMRDLVLPWGKSTKFST